MTPLHVLQQVQGVSGAFMIDARGGLIMREAPAFYPDGVFAGIGLRLPTIFAAAGEGLSTANEALIRCSLQSLFLRRMSNGYLAVICQQGVQISALRVAVNIVSAQLDLMVGGSAPWPSIPPAAEGQRQTPAPQANPAIAPKRQATRTGIWG